MLNTLIIISFVAWLVNAIVKGFCLYSLVSIIPVIMFSMRKFDMHLKWGSMLGIDLFCLFFSVTWQLLFHKFILWKLIVTIICRAVIIGIAIYDDVAYVYIQEERKRK